MQPGQCKLILLNVRFGVGGGRGVPAGLGSLGLGGLPGMGGLPGKGGMPEPQDVVQGGLESIVCLALNVVQVLNSWVYQALNYFPPLTLSGGSGNPPEPH